MKYQVKISAVPKDNQSRVSLYLKRIFGQKELRKVRELIKNGGVVKDDFSKSEANNIARNLRNLGAVVEVTKILPEKPEEGYRLMLINDGGSKISAGKVVKSITGMGISACRKLVESVPILVKVFENKEEAYKALNKFKEIGAFAVIENDHIETNEGVKFVTRVNGNPSEFRISLKSEGSTLTKIEELVVCDDLEPDSKENSIFSFSISGKEISKLKGLSMIIKCKF